MIFGINTTHDISKSSQISLAQRPREITYNNFEISVVVIMLNITTNHAITYTNLGKTTAQVYMKVSTSGYSASLKSLCSVPIPAPVYFSIRLSCHQGVAFSNCGSTNVAKPTFTCVPHSLVNSKGYFYPQILLLIRSVKCITSYTGCNSVI